VDGEKAESGWLGENAAVDGHKEAYLEQSTRRDQDNARRQRKGKKRCGV